jgi:group I intron endonuclease
LINNKRYVGSSVDLSGRLYKYFNLKRLTEGPEKDRQIARALVKYGYSNFRLEILEYCTPEAAVEREQYYLDLLKPEYNTLLRARSSFGYKHTDESLAKMSGESHIFFGKTHSELSKQKIRQALLGENNPNFAKSISEEQKVQIAHAQPNSFRISVLDLETKTETIYSSVREGARALNCSTSPLNYNIKTGGKYKGRYIIKNLGLLNLPLNDQPKSKASESFEVLDDKGLLINSFSSVNDCAIFYGVSPRTIRRRVAKFIYFPFKGKNLMIRRLN